MVNNYDRFFFLKAMLISRKFKYRDAHLKVNASFKTHTVTTNTASTYYLFAAKFLGLKHLKVYSEITNLNDNMKLLSKLI